MLDLILDVFLETLLDCLKLLPFLFLTYLLMEFLEHRAKQKTTDLLRKNGILGPLCGSVAGALPQCGFSAAAAGLYAARLITLGTLFAVFLSTSDEMLPILLSAVVNGSMRITQLLGILFTKILIALICGCLVDGVIHLIYKGKSEKPQHQIYDLCEQEHCHCERGGIVRSALTHTVRIILFVFVVLLFLNIIVHAIGTQRLGQLVAQTGILAVFITPLIGLIPNCAASVLISNLFLEQMIGYGTMLSGLLTASGVGILILFRQNRPMRQNFIIAGILYFIGCLVGLIGQWILPV